VRWLEVDQLSPLEGVADVVDVEAARLHSFLGVLADGDLAAAAKCGIADPLEVRLSKGFLHPS
jgi:hypothetical protein